MSNNLRDTRPGTITGGGDGGLRVRPRPWSVFDAVRAFPSTPEALMAEIDAAIATAEYTRASAQLQSERDDANTSVGKEEAVTASVSPSASPSISVAAAGSAASYDARIADEAYKAACAALTAGRPESAVRSLRVALASCPPDKSSAIAKLRSLLAIANSQLQKQKQTVPR